MVFVLHTVDSFRAHQNERASQETTALVTNATSEFVGKTLRIL